MSGAKVYQQGPTRSSVMQTLSVLEQMDKILGSVYEAIDKLPDQCLPVKYKGSASVAPQRAENPYNAW